MADDQNQIKMTRRFFYSEARIVVSLPNGVKARVCGSKVTLGPTVYDIGFYYQNGTNPLVDTGNPLLRKALAQIGDALHDKNKDEYPYTYQFIPTSKKNE